MKQTFTPKALTKRHSEVLNLEYHSQFSIDAKERKRLLAVAKSCKEFFNAAQVSGCNQPNLVAHVLSRIEAIEARLAGPLQKKVLYDVY